MNLREGISSEYREYLLELEPEEEEILVELGRNEIVNDKRECINYAVKHLISQYIGIDED